MKPDKEPKKSKPENIEDPTIDPKLAGNPFFQKAMMYEKEQKRVNMELEKLISERGVLNYRIERLEKASIQIEAKMQELADMSKMINMVPPPNTIPIGPSPPKAQIKEER